MALEKIKQDARHIMLGNVEEGYSDLLHQKYCYVQPSKGNYPFQFFWDTCMHTHILVALEEYDLAKRSLTSLFAMQEDDGFVGHMIFWNSTLPQNKLNVFQAKPTLQQLRPHMSALIQPPLAAQAVLQVYQATKDLKFLQTMIPKLKNYHQWLQKNRDFEGSGLLSIIASFESGMDWKPSYDPVLGFDHGLANESLFRKVIWGVDFQNFIRHYNLERIYHDDYFIVKDAGFNSIYALDLFAMASLCQINHDTQAGTYQKQAQKVTQAIQDQMYDSNNKVFYDLYSHQNKKSRILTPTIFFPLVLPGIPDSLANEVIDAHLTDPTQFGAPFPVPSVSLSDPSFFPYESKFLWRGPTWVITNWFLYKCLKHRQRHQLATSLKQSILQLIEQSGFREYYNPLSGQGYGAKNFTWSGLILDMAP